MEIKSKKNIVEAKGGQFIFYNTEKCMSLPFIIKEIFIENCYGLDNISFKEGDIIIDIGAHIGVFSIYLAKKFPEVKILAFEPSEIIYDLLLKNISLNNAKNIRAFNLAAYKDSLSELNIYFNESDSCASSVFLKKEYYNKVKTISLDDIIKNNDIKKIKLLKMDCEGSEYDIIYNSKLFNNENIEKLAIEIHEIPGQGYKKLLSYILDIFEKNNIFYKIISFNENNHKVIGNSANPMPKEILIVEQKDDKNIFYFRKMPFKDRAARLIGKFGIFLKNNNPKIYYLLKKFKKTDVKN